MLFENVGRDERQLVHGFTEFGGHASRSHGHEAYSVDGSRNLPHNQTDRISEMRWPISADTIEKFEDWGSLWSSRCYWDGAAWERGGSLRNPVLTAKWRRFATVRAIFPGYPNRRSG